MTHTPKDARPGLRHLAAVALAMCGLAAPASAQAWHTYPYWNGANNIPVSGRPVPQLTWLDDEMKDFMNTRSIPGGVMGISRNGNIVYLRGFGHNYTKGNLPENTPFQLASVSKPITAAAARHLISTGAIDLDDFAFDRGQTIQSGQFTVQVGGILPSPKYAPFGTSAQNVEKITVSHLLFHRSGWYAGPQSGNLDYAFHDVDCAADMGVASPPGSVNKIRWIQSKPLGFVPGEDAEYSNINYLILGEIVQHVSGMSLEEYVRTHVMTPDLWIPSTEIFGGHSFRAWQNPREPYYKTLNAHPNSATGPLMVENVFDSVGPSMVERPYGGHDVEAAVPFGGFVASTEAMLRFAEAYNIGYSTNPASSFALPVVGTVNTSNYNGSLPGFETRLVQIDTVLNGSFRFFVAFNQRSNSNFFSGHWPTVFLDSVQDSLTSLNQTYPGTTSDGFWTQLGTELTQGVGGYNTPFRGFQRMLDQTTTGSKVRLLPGAQGWTGVLDRQMLLDAPLGEVLIGQ